MVVKKPTRVRHVYQQRIHGDVATVFGLLCPVREKDWANGWNPDLVLSESGVVEPDCVFVTPGLPQPSVWLVTKWDPVRYSVSFVKVTPGFVVTQIQIRLETNPEGSTLAEVSYSYTALGSDGEAYVASLDENTYRAFMKEWEGELNYYLEHASKKPALGHHET